MTRPFRASALTRRDLLGLLATGAGFGAVASLAEQVGVAQTPGWLTARTPNPSFPKGAIIRTILKDLSPNDLRGATLMHEHLIGLGSYSSPPPNCPMPCTPSVAGAAISGVDLLVDELKSSAADGIACIVNSTTSRPTEQNMRDLRDLSSRSGMHIVAGGGYFREAYPKDFMQQSEDQFADALVK